MKFSTEVSDALAAARVEGPEAADADNKVYIAAFQQLLLNSPCTCDVLKIGCQRRAHIHTLFSGKGKYSC